MTANEAAVPEETALDDTAAREEIVRLHRIIERWLSGRARVDGPDLDEFRAALAPGFTMVDPDGDVGQRDEVLAMVRAAHGVQPTIKIRICDVALVASDAARSTVVVARYREDHHGTTAQRPCRFATVVFIRDDHAPHGPRWKHLHETWALSP
jgi:hypothetical protein